MKEKDEFPNAYTFVWIAYTFYVERPTSSSAQSIFGCVIVSVCICVLGRAKSVKIHYISFGLKLVWKYFGFGHFKDATFLQESYSGTMWPAHKMQSS